MIYTCCLHFEITPYIAFTALLYCSPFPYFCAQNINSVSKLKLCFKSRNLHHSWLVFHKNGKVFSENFWLSLSFDCQLGIEFYLFVSHGGMNDRGSTCKFRNAWSAFLNLHVDPLPFIPPCGSSFFHTSMRNKQVEFNPYIYTLSKLSRFGYEISVFEYTTGRYSKQPPEQPGHTVTSRLSLYGKMDVKIFLMFIVAENTRSVNI